MDLVIAPGPGVPQGLVVPEAELSERFSRSGGPGGQGVNTTDSRVQLTLDLAASTAFTERQRERLLTSLAGRLDGSLLRIDASEHRHQRRNRAAARERMAALLRDALSPPPPSRRATKPSRGSVRRRLEAKKRRSETKRLRGRPTD
ncbi:MULTISPECIES: alternative ribosome rescue aminoacyl-tRNA hydrolase ArfB [unclassified Luteococcus]|uniref:alternative ribosome rescue aminoacyl-tRNA hydrolase ArfB n=1 Tax=unclassified Luteococcus TaxID=2639923 RepID=UPI00313EBF23